MEHSNEIGELAKALSQAQSQLKAAEKSAINPHYNSPFANLKDIWEAITLPLTKNGLSVIQTTDPHESGVILNTMLCHSSGQWIKGKLFMRPVKNDPQAVGSAITYARRYALSAIVGVYQEDDDGNLATHAVQPKPRAHIQIKNPAPSFDDYQPSMNHVNAEFNQVNPDMVHDYNQVQDEALKCEICKTELKKSKSGSGWYCPNFKDKSKGEHTFIRG